MGARLAPTPAGVPTMLVCRDGREVYWHSRYDPLREASRFAEQADIEGADTVIFLGLGLGYHLQALLPRLDKDGMGVILVEKDPAILRYFLEFHDVSQLLKHPYACLLCGEMMIPDIASYIRDLVSPRRYQKPNWKAILWPPAEKVDQLYYQQISRSIKEAVQHVATVVGTDIHMVPLWPKNIWQNIGYVLDSAPVAALQGALSGIPWILIASGPSLEDAMDDLRELRNYAVLCCAGSAYRSLLQHNVVPHLVVSVDAKDLNFVHFEGIGSSKTFLVFDPMICSGILEREVERRFVCQVQDTRHTPPLLLLERVFGPPGLLMSGFSVATTCFSLGLHTGATPVVFVGQDLAIGKGRSHVAGNRLCTTYDPALHAGVEIEANDGGRCTSMPGWVVTLRTFEAMLARTKWPCYNTSWHGARMQGAPYRSLKDIRKSLTEQVDVPSILQEHYRPLAESPEKVSRLREEVERELQGLEELALHARACRDRAAQLLMLVLGRKPNPRLEQLAHEVQRQLDKMQKDERLFWIGPWFHEVNNYLQKSEKQREPGVDPYAWEVNRGGIYFEGVQKAAGECLKSMRVGLEKIREFEERLLSRCPA